MASPQQKKCSACRKTGHNKRTCPDLRVAKKKRTKPVVHVKVVEDAIASSHVVDLGHKRVDTPWHEITAYREAPKPITKRVTVNFAELIRHHHAQVRQAQEQTVIPQELPRVEEAIPLETAEPVIQRIKTPRRSLIEIIVEKREALFEDLATRFTVKRLVAVGVTICLLAMIPFPAMSYYYRVQDDSRRIIEQSTNAFLALQSSTIAALNADLPQAQFDLGLALQAFSEAKDFIEQDHKALFFVAEMMPVVGTHVSSRTHLLQAGQHLALANTYLVKGIDEASAAPDSDPTQRLRVLRHHVAAALPQYESALEELSAVHPKVIPAEYQEVFYEFKLLYAAFVHDLNELVGLIDTLSSLLGDDVAKSYLVIAQNNQELRATGGFAGSFAIVSVQKGKITRVEVPKGGTYDVQGQLSVFVKPPVPLQIVNKRWEFQDANWFPDFPASAQKIAWFYENAWSESVDGVIAVNGTVLERVLSAMGPVTTEDGLLLSGDTALVSLRSEIEEANADGSTQPKAVLAEGLDAILEQLRSADMTTLLRLLAALGTALEEREIQIYIDDTKRQQTISDFGWSGEISKVAPKQDFIKVVATNIGGGKSDARMSQHISHQAFINPITGEVTNTVIIERTHSGTEDELFYGAANLSYVRVYVPEGATLVEAGGFDFPPEEAFLVPEPHYEDDADLVRIEDEVGFDPKTGTRITNEFGKTAFGNWMAVAPGESVKAYVVYTLPFNVLPQESVTEETNIEKWRSLLLPEQTESARYSLFVEKQSGINATFTSSIIVPDTWQPAWRSRDDMELAENGARFETVLYTDEVIGLVIEKKESQE